MVPKLLATMLPDGVAEKDWVKVWVVKPGVKLTVVPAPPAEVAEVGRPVEAVVVEKMPLLPVILAWAVAKL